MRVAVIGTGYVGLVTGACLADLGHEVWCVDNDAEKIDRLLRGDIPIYEPGLDRLIGKCRAAGLLSFTVDLKRAVAAAGLVLIAVGTPPRRGSGHADLGNVYAVAAEIAAALTGYTVIVTKSTVPVGTGDEIERIIRDVNPRANVSVASNPEFLREGAAIDDFKRPDRIIVGTEDDRAQQMIVELYRPLGLDHIPLLIVGRRTAELTKYAANAFLAMKLTFINEIADLCEQTCADVAEVARGIGLDRRISSKFLAPGPGFGGSCFPKDTLALARIGEEHGVRLRLVETTVAVNSERKSSMGHRIIAACGGSVRGKLIGLLGLTFKPDTDDMRDAPSIDIMRVLRGAGAKVQAYDPQGPQLAKDAVRGVHLVASPYEAAAGAVCLVVVTEWQEFRELDLARVRSIIAEPVLVDLRNIYRRAEVADLGFIYHCIGRPDAPAADFTQIDFITPKRSATLAAQQKYSYQELEP